jgi:hypothetical protein
MRTSIEIPDELFRRAKLRAVADGTTLRELVIRGLSRELTIPLDEREQKLQSVFGAFKDRREAIDEIDQIVQEEFSQIDPEDWK